jgi:hypothetical protein
VNVLNRALDKLSSTTPVNEFVADADAYDRARHRFEGRLGSQRSDWLAEYHDAGGECFGGLDIETAAHLYALVCTQEPEVVVETGVCNGTSTLAFLLGIDHNGHGQLHSVDYPYFADEELAEFRAETFDEYGGAAIPADKSPGWIVPDRLRDRWDLRIGKSQHELPQLLPEIAPVDVFLHDSEHSHPCQMFEYELGWHHLDAGGLLVSDDTGWTRAFETFASVRGDGPVAHPVDGMGAIRKPGGVSE